MRTGLKPFFDAPFFDAPDAPIFLFTQAAKLVIFQVKLRFD